MKKKLILYFKLIQGIILYLDVYYRFVLILYCKSLLIFIMYKNVFPDIEKMVEMQW